MHQMISREDAEILARQDGRQLSDEFVIHRLSNGDAVQRLGLGDAEARYVHILSDREYIPASQQIHSVS